MIIASFNTLIKAFEAIRSHAMPGFRLDRP
jgi:hypothetical protein